MSTSSRLLSLVVVAAAFGGVACGPSHSRGPVAVSEKGRASSAAGAGFDDQAKCEWKGREDREMSETTGPGALLPNVRRVYQVIGTGDDRRKVIVCREIDTNLDGYKDVVRTFNDKGEALHEEADSNYDGKIDTWITFASGRIAKEALDGDGDGQPEEWKYYSGGQLSRAERDTNKDTKADVFEFYVKGRVERIGVDVDFDGHVDRWDHDEMQRRLADATEKAGERSAGATGKAADSSVQPEVPAADADPAKKPDAQAGKPTSGSKRKQNKPPAAPKK
jgi:hypothetical protein